jgi:DNA-binding MarR family transcriptional regulator
VTLTDDGRRLLDRFEAASRELDADLGAPLTDAQRSALTQALHLVAARVGLP